MYTEYYQRKTRQTLSPVFETNPKSARMSWFMSEILNRSKTSQACIIYQI